VLERMAQAWKVCPGGGVENVGVRVGLGASPRGSGLRYRPMQGS